ncbi:MAG: hypothetical protein ACLU3I_11170 [Acutalibacteraceae bacterium]
MVYWISADPRVASVLWNGVVTGVSEGCTFVTALYAGQVKRCTVWVYRFRQLYKGKAL